jgi:regulator of protease activity HflC (stomatin/prohibitin superfamily)
MGIVIFGIVILVVGFLVAKTPGPLTKYKSLFTLAGIVLIVIGVLTAGVRQIDTGHVGVQKLFGEVKEDILYEGLNLVNPLIEVYPMTTKTQNYTMSSTVDEGQVKAADAITVLSQDGLEVNIDLTILYKVIGTEAPKIVRTIGLDYEAKVIRPTTRTRIREVAVYYNATDLYSAKREEFENKIKAKIEKDFAERGLILEQMLIRKIDLPKSVKESIERKITAVQEAQRMEYVLQKEQQEAERKRVEARGVADAQKIINEGLSPKLLKFEEIKMQKEIANSPNSKIIIMGDGKSSPFIIDTK